MNELWNAWKGAASAVAQQQGQSRWGVVQNVKPTDAGYVAKVLMQPENVLSGWLPVLTPMVGPEWGLVCPPEPGMQAFVAADSGDGHHGVILGLTYSLQNMPPVPKSDFDQQKGVAVQSGEIALVSKKGAVLRLCADGSIHIEGNVRINGTLTVDQTITSRNGDITAAKGNVSDTHGSLDRLRRNYNVHHHTPTEPPPIQQDPE